MKRLSLLDALFLYMETPETPMHVAGVTIFKPASPQDDLFARFRDHVTARLDLLPSYRRHLEPTPLGIDHPAWVIEDKLDLDYHIRHAALPKPGGMEELRALIAQLHAVPLDRSRPLWEYTLVEGLEGGAFAVYGKFHDSMMDGVAGMATLGVTFDFAPGAEHESLPQRIVDRSSGRRAVRRHRVDKHSDRRLRPAGVAGGEGAARRRPGADESCAEFRTRRALPLQLREGHAPNALQQGHFRPPRLCDLIAAAGRGQGALQVAARHDQRRRAGALRRRSPALSNRTCGAAAKAADCRRAGVAAASRQRAAQQPGRVHPLPPADRRRRAAAPARRGAGRRPGGEEPVRRHARPGDDGRLDPRRAARRNRLGQTVGRGARIELSFAALQYDHLERAGTEAADVLRRSASDALFPGFDSLPRLCAQHHRAQLPRSARFRPHRLQRSRARCAADSRLYR